MRVGYHAWKRSNEGGVVGRNGGGGEGNGSGAGGWGMKRIGGGGGESMGGDGRKRGAGGARKGGGGWGTKRDGGLGASAAGMNCGPNPPWSLRMLARYGSTPNRPRTDRAASRPEGRMRSCVEHARHRRSPDLSAPGIGFARDCENVSSLIVRSS